MTESPGQRIFSLEMSPLYRHIPTHKYTRTFHSLLKISRQYQKRSSNTKLDSFLHKYDTRFDDSGGRISPRDDGLNTKLQGKEDHVKYSFGIEGWGSSSTTGRGRHGWNKRQEEMQSVERRCSGASERAGRKEGLHIHQKRWLRQWRKTSAACASQRF